MPLDVLDQGEGIQGLCTFWIFVVPSSILWSQRRAHVVQSIENAVNYEPQKCLQLWRTKEEEYAEKMHVENVPQN